MSFKTFAFNLLDRAYIRLLGPIYFSAIFVAPVSTYFSEKVSKGTNLIWITLAIVGVAIYVQIKKMKTFFESDSLIRSFTSKSRSIRWYFYFMNAVGGGIFIWLLVHYYQAYQNSTPPHITLYGYPILAAIFYTFFSFLFGASAIGVLYTLLFMGPISNGVSLAITFHNWANGMGLSYQIFIQYFIDFSFPDLLALVVNMAWLTLSFNLSKGVDIPTPG